jgi:TetR/AcrR family tetracycline transcriptional repressor
MARQQGRPKAGQEPLTRERIITAALELVRQDGVSSLTMRTLATALKVDPMSIYHYLPGKAAVIAGMVEKVFGELKVPVREGASWQERVRAFAKAYNDLTCSHSSLTMYLVTDAEAAAQASLPANEILYRALVDSGLPPHMIIHAADLIIDYLNGFALATSVVPLPEPNERQELFAVLDEKEEEEYPVLRSVLKSLPEAQTPHMNEAELEIILAGIEAIVARGSA